MNVVNFVMRFFKNRSISWNWKLGCLVAVVNLSVLLLSAGALSLFEYWFSSRVINVLGVQWNVVPLIFSAAFFLGLLLTAGLQSFVSKPILENESEARYERACRGAHDGLWDWDLKTDQIYFSPRWQALLGYAPGEIESKPSEWFERIYPEDFLAVQDAIAAHLNGETPYFEQVFRIQHKDAGCRWMLSRALMVRNDEGTPVYLSGSQSDITAQKLAERSLVHDGTHDSLTGLSNQTLFLELLEQALRRRKNRGYHFAVLFLDLDRFKVINDGLGRSVGDQVLIDVAQRLKKCVRDQDTIARLGGDEFTLLLDDIGLPDHASIVAERIQKDLERSFQVDKQMISVSSSIGMVTKTTGYRKAEDLLRDAHIAMQGAKAVGSGRLQVFELKMHKRMVARLSLENELRSAIKNEDFEVYYQPILSLQSGQIRGFEALIRWNHAEKGLVSPAEFVPLAEETDLIVPMDRWVLRQACHQLKIWQKCYPQKPRLQVSVNMSGKQFVDFSLIEEVDYLLEKTDFLGEDLHIEITETVIMNNFDIAKKVLEALKDRGIQLSMDDFGTGYSSLSYLNRFPFHTIKIDRSFISRITEEGQQEITKAIISLAEDLGMNVVAEGIETKAQLEILRALKCGYAQGFLFSKPLSRKAVEALLSEKQVMAVFREISMPNISSASASEAA